MWFRDILIAQQEYLVRESKRIENQLQVLPKEKLIEKHAKGKSYFYIWNGERLVSLQKNEKLIHQCLLKGSLERKLSAINQNIPILQRAIKSYRPLTEVDFKWDDIEAQQNTFYDEQRVHVWQGIRFASKSEMLIAMALTSYGIEFKYESKLYVNGRYIYPDFIIKRPKDGKVFIWEPNYKKSSTFLKLLFCTTKSLNQCMLNRLQLHFDNIYLSFVGSNFICCVSNA